ncbi:MAG: type II toxin-antitoxin system VapC family toxin [Actinomycetota bacterium]|nr:type II toxin-antitoxin system VapC family toxin [Actinomycetota bacterium]
MIVLDTDVVSELIRPEPSEAVLAWADEAPSSDLWLTAVTVAELLYGMDRLADGRRKRRLAAKVDSMVSDHFADRVAPFDGLSAAHYADIVATREHSGRPISVADAQIAAITRSHGAILATRSTRDFAGAAIPLSDPWAAA